MRLSFGRIVFGAILIVVGIGWLLREAGIIDIPLGALAPIALIVIGVALVAGAWRGSQTGLIVAGAILVLILATNSTNEHRFGRDFRRDVADNVERPLVAPDIHPYRLGAGTILIDLTRLELTKRTYKVDAHVRAGQIRVTAPSGVPLRIDASTGAGTIEGPGNKRSGISVSLRTEDKNYPERKPRIDLHLRAGVGSIRVTREPRVAA